MALRPPKDLVRHWYNILKEDGFNDIEDTESPNEFLKRWDSSYFGAGYHKEVFENRRRYFEMAEEFLATHMFKTVWDREIWRLHSMGRSLREIAKIVNRDKMRVSRTIHAYQRKMRDAFTSGH